MELSKDIRNMQQKSRKKILMITEWYEPGFKAGGPIQACKNVVACLKEEYDFFILCSDRDHGDKVPYPDIPLNQWINNEKAVDIWYASADFMRSAENYEIGSGSKARFCLLQQHVLLQVHVITIMGYAEKSFPW